MVASPLPAKPLAARVLEARSRAKDQRRRVYVVIPQHVYRISSASEPGTVHTLTRTRDGWTCTCRGWMYSGICVHASALLRRSEREGWSYGRIARPVTLATRYHA